MSNHVGPAPKENLLINLILLYAPRNFEGNSLDIPLNFSLAIAKRVIKFLLSDDFINPNYEIEDWSSIPNERLNTVYRAFLQINNFSEVMYFNVTFPCVAFIKQHLSRFL